ncbi:hypothetical protein SH2C18_16830 [Clostridium sediminicola]|uniref:YcaO-like family protein n=1 Tax=Clostridium sediminicola TaxID=3114879 RepID=UPI0031F21A35
MSHLIDREYKDETPLNTINNIRKILSDIGLLTIESNWKNSANGFYSVSVSIEGTSISSNGKGTTAEFALASAYGELMERLQNMAYFRLSNDMSDEDNKYGGFYYAPDEKFFSVSDFLNCGEEWIDAQKDNIGSKRECTSLMKKWLGVSYEKVPCDFVTLPYYNLITSKISHIPIKMISKMYMSNGMCAGNTSEEALVQGISEIFERVVNKAIVNDKIVPPTIPEEYLAKFKGVYLKIKQIESKGNFKVIVKDCSLEKNYPVVAVIFINKDSQSYFIKFGAHPVFKIAIDRTLNELLQGQDINQMMGMKKFHYKKNIKDPAKNLMKILENGSGHYPSELFTSDFSYKFTPFKRIKCNTNKEIFKYLVNLLKEMGYSIMVRDVSFLGVPAYHVIVPNFSEIEKINDMESIISYSDYNIVKRYIRNLYKIDDDGINELLCFINGFKYGKSASAVGLLNIPMKNLFPWYYMNIDLFRCVLYFKIKDYGNAKKSISKYINYVGSMNYDDNSILYYECIRDYIGCKIDKLPKNKVKNLLNKFYPEQMVEIVDNQFNNPQIIFEKFGELKCWNCGKCDVKECCGYYLKSNVFRTLKDQQQKNTIDQKKLKNIIKK